jgi:phosphate transport system substrate-binding protein
MKKMLKSSVAAAVALVGFAGIAAPAIAKGTTTACYPLYPTGKVKVKNVASCTVTAATAAGNPLLTAATATFGANMGSNTNLDSDLSIPSGVSLNFDGSSFIAPFVQGIQSGTGTAYWNPVHSVTWTTYNAAGSGQGRTDVTSNAVNVGFSDQPLTATGGNAANNANPDDYVQVPEAFGAAVVAYNLGNSLNNLKLSASIIAGIYMGTITSWADPSIVTLNGGAGSRIGKKLNALPSLTKTIKVYERGAKSGTNYAFTDYLNKATGTTPAASGNPLDGQGWHATFAGGAANNQAMAQDIANTSGSIGYVEYGYLLIPGNDTVDKAMLQDQAGTYISPSSKAIAAALKAAGTGISVTNFSAAYLPGANVWPISTFSWAIIKKNQSGSANAGEAAVKFLDWMAHAGQAQAAANGGFVALPAAIQNFDRAQLMQVVSGTQPLLTLAN